MKFRINQRLLTLGGTALGVGAAVEIYSPVSGNLVLRGVSLVLISVGILVILAGLIELPKRSRVKVISKWDQELIRKALRSAPAKSSVKIRQTWIPDREAFCPFLEELLGEGDKQFSFQILLMDKECEALPARIHHRAEDLTGAKREIEGSINRFAQMKVRVDTIWETKYLGAKLDLNVRTYRFMPFGPIYVIGNEVMFVGFYINYDSSIHAPMLILQNPDSKIWKGFARDFSEGWTLSVSQLAQDARPR